MAGKWLKFRLTGSCYRENDSTLDYVVQLAACVFKSRDGIIVGAEVGDKSFDRIVDNTGMVYNIFEWDCKSLEEFELQAMMNGCLFGLKEHEESAIKEALNGLLVKQLREAKEKIWSLENVCNKLRLAKEVKEDAIRNLEDELHDILMAHIFDDDCTNPESWERLVEELSHVIGLEPDEVIERWQRPSASAGDGKRNARYFPHEDRGQCLAS